jgi:hypothetical protein
MANLPACPKCGKSEGGTYYECKKCGRTGHISAGWIGSSGCISSTEKCPSGGTHDLKQLNYIDKR